MKREQCDNSIESDYRIPVPDSWILAGIPGSASWIPGSASRIPGSASRIPDSESELADSRVHTQWIPLAQTQ